MKPITAISRTTKMLRSRSASVRPDQHGRAGHRQRPEALDEPLLQVVGEADARRERTEDDRLHEDARHQVVDVVLVAGHGDAAAEHVAEHQHEDDRLDRCEHEQLRIAPDVEQVAPGDRERVGRGPRAHVAHHEPVGCLGRRGRVGRRHARLRAARRDWGASPSGPSALFSAAWPVSERNTSSRVGSRSIIVVGVRCAASRMRTVSSIAAAPLVTLTCSMRPSVVTAPMGARLVAAAPRPPAVVRETDLDHGRAHAGLELCRGALGDDRCRGRSPRSGRRGGRLPRGTAS